MRKLTKQDAASIAGPGQPGVVGAQWDYAESRYTLTLSRGNDGKLWVAMVTDPTPKDLAYNSAWGRMFTDFKGAFGKKVDTHTFLLTDGLWEWHGASQPGRDGYRALAWVDGETMLWIDPQKLSAFMADAASDGSQELMEALEALPDRELKEVFDAISKMLASRILAKATTAPAPKAPMPTLDQLPDALRESIKADMDAIAQDNEPQPTRATTVTPVFHFGTSQERD